MKTLFNHFVISSDKCIRKFVTAHTFLLIDEKFA